MDAFFVESDYSAPEHGHPMSNYSYFVPDRYFFRYFRNSLLFSIYALKGISRNLVIVASVIFPIWGLLGNCWCENYIQRAHELFRQVPGARGSILTKYVSVARPGGPLRARNNELLQLNQSGKLKELLIND